MTFQTKQIFDNSKFQQLTDSNLDLSGSTVIHGVIKYNTNVTLTGNTQLTYKSYVDNLVNSKKDFVQSGHTFSIGDVIGYDSVNNLFTGVTATLNSFETLGVVTNTTGSSFTLCFNGYFNFSGSTILDDVGEPLSAGTVYYLSTTSVGKLTAIETTEENTISKPILTTLTNNDCLIYNYRGNIIEVATSDTGTTTVTANNGLNKIGDNIRLGGSLTGNTTITTATGSRLNLAGFPVQYSTDLSGSFVPRSLVDKGYVTGITTTLTTTANNGLNKIGTNFRLGGSLTGATTITTTSGNVLQVAGFPITYTTDLSGNFVPRSLVDKGYVTGITNTLTTTANNGVTKTGTNFRLGGSLTGNTTITTATGSRLNFAGFPVQYSTDLSGNFVPRSLVDKGYVTGITDTLQTKSSINTLTGTTLPATYASKTVVITGVTNGGILKTGQNISLNESILDLGNVSGSVTLDLSMSRNFKCVATGNITSFDFTNEVIGATYSIQIETNTSNKTIAYAAGKFRWSHGSIAIPQLTQCTTNGSSPAKAIDLLVMRCSVSGKLDIALNYNLIEN